MRQVVVAVYDVAADCFARPWFVGAIGLALRAFTDEVNRSAPDNPIFQHSADFHLYRLGEFDDSSGEFIVSGKPERICTGNDVKIT